MTADDRRWMQAHGLLDEMRSAGVTPDVYSYSSAISACEKGGELTRALDLLREMRARGVSPNVISFSAAVAACAKGGLWNEALALLEQMRQVIATDCGLIAFG